MAKRKDTKREIAESLKKLIISTPMEKITINDIVQGANVIRPTFYNHFKDKYEVLEYIVREDLLMPIRPLLVNDMIVEGVTLLLSSAKNEWEFYSHAVWIEGQNSFESITRQEVINLLLGIMEEKSGGGQKEYYKYSWLTREAVAEFYAQSICYMAISWIRRDFLITPKEVSEIYDFLTHHNMLEVLESV